MTMTEQTSARSLSLPVMPNDGRSGPVGNPEGRDLLHLAVPSETRANVGSKTATPVEVGGVQTPITVNSPTRADERPAERPRRSRTLRFALGALAILAIGWLAGQNMEFVAAQARTWLN